MKHISSLSLLVAGALLGLCLVACRPSHQEASDPLAAGLDSLFSSLFPATEPGAAVLVARGDSILYEGCFGLARLDTLQPITPHTLFNICSVSKQFSAVALALLAQEGLISLDDPVQKFFPRFRAPFFRRITLRHLLSHTSGLPDARPRTPQQWQRYTALYPTRFSQVDDFRLYCEEDESCRFFEQLDFLAFEPGTHYEYQNPTYQLVLMIVEQVTGEKFDDWMRSHLFLPAGMEETTYFEPQKYIPRMAHGYERDTLGRWQECDYGEASFFGTKADGGIYTTPREFLRWDAALYHGHLISDSLRRELHTPRIATDIPHTAYGYGWFIEQRPDRPLKIYHTGDNGGFYIFEGRFPSLDLFYLVFANRADWSREAVAESVDSLLLRLCGND